MPEGLDDCISAVNYIIDHAAELHIDGNHITIGGDSSGGNLALATAMSETSCGKTESLLLFYPVTKAFDDGSESWQHGRTCIGYAQGTQLFQAAGYGVGAWYLCHGRGAQALVQDDRDVFQMVAPTKIDAEERKHNVTVLITIAGAADIETAVHQHGQSRALEFLHHIKNPAEGNDVLVFYSYLCHA